MGIQPGFHRGKILRTVLSHVATRVWSCVWISGPRPELCDFEQVIQALFLFPPLRNADSPSLTGANDMKPGMMT